MNNQYFPTSADDYFPPYNYSFNYASPSPSAYYASSFVPPTCPYHSPQMYYPNPTIPSMSQSPMPFTYQQTPPSTVQLYSPSTQTRTSLPALFLEFSVACFLFLAVIDRTPLRRHQCFKKNEIQILHQVYLRDSHPASDVLRQLAEQLNVSIEKVRVSYLNVFTAFACMIQSSF